MKKWFNYLNSVSLLCIFEDNRWVWGEYFIYNWEKLEKGFLFPSHLLKLKSKTAASFKISFSDIWQRSSEKACGVIHVGFWQRIFWCLWMEEKTGGFNKRSYIRETDFQHQQQCSAINLHINVRYYRFRTENISEQVISYEAETEKETRKQNGERPEGWEKQGLNMAAPVLLI